jgi:hypothetical protein
VTLDDGYFREEVARTYDEDSDPMFAPEVVTPTVDLLAELAGPGPALEFGIGTGRIALPLATRGVRVAGIDLSGAMLDRLRAKPGGDAVAVTRGDFSTTRVAGAFQLVYLVFNTIQNVTSQAGQVDVFRNAAAHLEHTGLFLIEVGMPDLQRLPPGDRFVPFDVSPNHLGFDEYDLANQGLTSHHWQRHGDRWDASSGPFRYVWPSEMDLMARIAGLEPRDRWSGWHREPFTSDSRRFVGTWRKP